ncbi:Mitochondrial inner membrane protease ATP23 [Porphyridium purpureum]|uniref:Mitochondrial inner membrane protease ATP23 n=1 Tax=Porphyridium purpureum TaxID=35688 RepID=A0A5J4YU57_PORPP|nr:Mitochondrial inner membrane protease ATP23 [Porphyridium purpureum]|eukprot:POR1071..scf227_4
MDKQARNYAVKHDAVVEAARTERQEVLARNRTLLTLELEFERAARGVESHCHCNALVAMAGDGTDSLNQRETREMQRCEKLRAGALSDPTVKFMLEHLQKAGCVMPEEAIRCMRCDERVFGGYQGDGSIVMAANHIATQGIANATLVHEMVHAFDECRAYMDWNSCKQHACSEVRAAALSGDCNWGKEIQRGNFNFANQFPRCIRRRAELSVAMNPNCGPVLAKEAVADVFEVCYNDTMPFDRIP